MPARAAARNDGEPGSEDPAPIKMSNQHTKLEARSEESAPPKLNDEHDTRAVPVRALMAPTQSPMPQRAGRGVHREPCSVPTVTREASALLT